VCAESWDMLALCWWSPRYQSVLAYLSKPGHKLRMQIRLRRL
jgi:hypothetical protein